MTNYKSCRIIEGKSKWVIVDEDGKISNKDPNKEELKYLQNEEYKFRTGKYNSTNTCEKCGEKLFSHINAFRERDKNEKCTGRWLCKGCMEINKYANRSKPITDCRSGNLDPNHPRTKGYIFEELTCKWRGIKNLNIENDNYNLSIDHSEDPELGIVQTKGRTLSRSRHRWSFSSLQREIDKIYGHLICYCTDENMENIERIYIFPLEIVIKRNSITIYKFDKFGRLYKDGWYEKYRLDDNIVEHVNKIFLKIRKSKKKKMI